MKNKIWSIVLLLCIAIMLTSCTKSRDHALAQGGVMDLSQWDVQKDGKVRLDGEWDFYRNKLYTPFDVKNIGGSGSEIVQIPSFIYRENDQNLLSKGNVYGTLRLRLAVKDEKQVYGLRTGMLLSSSRIWINGRLISQNGVVGTNKKEYMPKYVTREMFFAQEGKDIEIVIQIANFHHRRARLRTIFLGTAEQIHSDTNRILAMECMVFGCLMIVAMHHLILFLQRKKNKSDLYFSLLCCLTALRLSVMGERFLIRFIPWISAEACSKLGYIPAYICMPILVIFLKEIFKEEIPDRLIKIMKKSVVIFTVLVLVLPNKVYDIGIIPLNIVNILIQLYILSIMIKAALGHRKEAYIVLLGGIPVILATINDVLMDYGVLQTTQMLSFGILSFVLSQSYLLAKGFGDAFHQAERLAVENENMVTEIQILNTDLEKTVEERTKKLEEANCALHKLSMMDGLTGIANRRSFDVFIREEWDKMQANGATLSLLLIDVDYFKNYNDYYGHVAGDDCLVKIARALASCARRTGELVARYGGEEFVVVLPSTNEDQAAAVGEKMRRTIEELHIDHEDSDVSQQVTISIGIATTTSKATSTLEKFLETADEALYVAKNRGRNQIFWETV